MKKLIPQKIKNIYHLFLAVLANIFYGFPSKKIKVIGVTGTNGKTTTIIMISRILEEAGYKVAMASTINFKIGEKEWINKTKFTTLSAWKVQKFIRRAIRANCQYLVLETSSHSLDQNRVWGIDYKVGVITNVTREHLDYHKTMEKYRKVKKKLFKDIEVAVVNLDMESPGDFLDCTVKKKYGYSIKNQSSKLKSQGDLSEVKLIEAAGLVIGSEGSRFELGGMQFSINLPGRFNVENALSAICVGLEEGINFAIIKKALEKIKVIPGRMENVPNSHNLNIIIDYAVTPDSLEKLYELISEMKKDRSGKKIIAVFGSCGERDRGKRPLMGKIVSANADFIIVTNEDPYNEDPLRIINEISAGIQNKNEGENFWKIPDRREAIKKALHLAGAGDFVIVTGKGAEETMAVGKKRIPWSDKKIILGVLQELKSG